MAEEEEEEEEESKPNRNLIFTYGTLKRGFPNHGLLQDLISSNDALFLGPYITVPDLPLVIGPYGVPYLINLPGSGHNRVHGELYSVSDRGLARLDELEGIAAGHYERLRIQIIASDGEAAVEAEAYYAHRSFAEEMWKKKGMNGVEVYSEDDGAFYLRRDFRPKHISFIEAIQLFLSSSSSSDSV